MTMIEIPLIEILFAIFLAIAPKETASFVIVAPMVGSSSTLWTLQEDGSRKGLSVDQQTAYGTWRTDGFKVFKLARDRSAEKVKVSPGGFKKAKGAFLSKAFP